ncbi:MAG: tRNA guanosine(34) transglycosylase Tgt [Phycisphaerales bacterium]
MPAITYEFIKQDTESRARLGRVTTPHGAFDTPAFMPVGTQASVKGLQPAQVETLGAQIILSNTYHLMLRPGSELVKKMGGLHHWMRWDKPILTDSGGFQVFSLTDINKINEDGVTFRSHIDGAMIELTPERSMRVQNELGADIIMAFDDCPPAGGDGIGDSGLGIGEDSAGRVGEPPTPNPQPPIPAASATLCRRTGLPRAYQARQRAHRALAGPLRESARPAQRAGAVRDRAGGRTWRHAPGAPERVTQHDLPGFAIRGSLWGRVLSRSSWRSSTPRRCCRWINPGT